MDQSTYIAAGIFRSPINSERSYFGRIKQRPCSPKMLPEFVAKALLMRLCIRIARGLLPLLISIHLSAQNGSVPLAPFVMNHWRGSASLVDLSFLHDAPAGKDGFIRVQNEHFIKPDGTRIRFWGVHLTDWSPGSVLLPPKEDIPMWASTLSRFGVNIVRLHFLDLNAPRGIIASDRDDTQHFDRGQLDRLDFLVSELKKRGIYVDLNLNVGRSYKAGDAVKDWDKIRWSKGITLFDPRLIELQKQYAHDILTHVNAYTGLEFRRDPVVALVEITNENGIGVGFHYPSRYYEQEITSLYNEWLTKNLSPDDLRAICASLSLPQGGEVPLLTSTEVKQAPADRYRAEVRFFIDLQKSYFAQMSSFLKDDLHVESPIIGTADHNHHGSPYPLLLSLSPTDVMDGHVYWEHPQVSGEAVNSPMVNDPEHSTVVQLSRTATAGKPYTVSETNHPFPNDYLSEGSPILAAYADFQNWDAVIAYTFEPKRSQNAPAYIGDPFDISLDPVRMTEFATGALVFLQHTAAPAQKRVTRNYSLDQVIASGRLPHSDWPYFTPGFPLRLPLEHEVRIGSLDGSGENNWPAQNNNGAITSDTGQLTWYTQPAGKGVVAVDTDQAESLIGFLKDNPRSDSHLSVQLRNEFAALVLCSLDGAAIAHAKRMLLTASSRVVNTDMQWRPADRRVVQQGGAPTLIEPVTGTLTFKDLADAQSIKLQPLDGSGLAMGDPIRAIRSGSEWDVSIGVPATTWYLVEVQR